MKKLIILAVLMSAVSTQAQEPQSFIQQPVVTVKGEGTVKVVPDQVLIRSRIEHEGNDAGEVKKQNDAAVAKILKYLKSRGIEEKNFRTEYMNLNKNYNYNDKTYSYVANQAISIKLEDLKNYEEVMSGLLEAGLNRIDGIEFQSSKKEEHESAARKKAVENAKLKAGEYAAALGQTIGNALNISEVETNNYQPVYRMEMMKSSADAGGEKTIAPGEMEVTARVTVSFKLN
ncbi:DUF541 domain-containing protein [Antarcticibacterium flavum]|uniref:DUF541 domain-containing protein n=1 Tax=Antarcticibacterium flavum TaxID=2058175 RepID=A0A5B7X1X4_9FLAO|nr:MULTISPECIES: SIMPL domain-containing protein [Antarcticibacterium]MCM4160280.1 SIMPL domain-containing protein [Antarcticibacterium sp. W02-3]QCY68651.1 DUF541 domain-containing protein [Antarcticibacterium flavum]